MTDTEFTVAYKLMRGMRQLDTLERRIERFLGGKANGIVHDRTTEPGYFIVRAFSRREPPPTCNALIGEYLYHERAALDHMACELARRNNQIVDKHVEWPIFLDRDDFRNPVSGQFTPAVKSRIGLIASKYHAIIEDEQPFQGRYGQPEDDPLAILYELSNYDRHQFIHLTSIVTQASFHDFTPREAAARFEQVSVSYGAFESQAEVARFRILPGPELDVNVQTQVRFNVAFGDGGPLAGRPVLNTLGSIGVRVGELLQRITAVP
jgi:hypothetical protein